MPRKAREYSITNVYHIIFRGNDKQDIFYDKEDRCVFLNMLKSTSEKFNYDIFAYCLMDNHIHLIIRVNQDFLSKSMHNLGLRYSIYFNKKFNRRGHLFENRFVSKKIENLSYFLNVCKYVHRNPESACMEKTEKYKWSSYKDYVKGKNSFINKKVLLHYFENDIEKFKQFTLENDDKEKMLQMVEFEIMSRLSEDELISIIKYRFNLSNACDVSLLSEKQKYEIINDLMKFEGISISQISRVTKVSIYYIKKFLDKKRKKKKFIKQNRPQ